MSAKRGSWSEDIHVQDLLCPRIWLEEIGAYRSYICSVLTAQEQEAFVSNPELIWNYVNQNISQQKRSFRVLRPADRYMECAVRPVFRKHQAFIQSRRDIQASANRNKQNRPGNCTAHFQLQTADRRRTKGIIFFFRDIGNVLVYIIPYQFWIGGSRAFVCDRKGETDRALYAGF